MERKLTAILSADVKGYSRLMGDNEEATIRTLTAYREVMTTLIQQHRGRVVDSPGDNLLAEFASAVDAVQGAVEIQQALKVRNAELSDGRKMEFRIGINVGDVIIEGERLYGDGVNIAARLEGLAEPGGICISGTVHDQVENKLALSYEYVGEQEVKNIAKPVRMYRMRWDDEENQKAKGKEQKAEKVVSRQFSVVSPCPPERRAGIARQKWLTISATGLLLIAGMIGIALYRPFSSFRNPLAPSVGGQSPIRTQEAQPPLPLPDKPSIAVLPFTNMSGDPEQEYFSDGMTEAIITGLSKLSGLFVIARNSVFTYKAKAVKVQDVGREMGVHYVLEGSVQKADQRVRITAQLIEATTGHHVWAESYDRNLSDIFALQDEVTQKIVLALKVKLTTEEQTLFQRAPTNNLEAYDYYLRGVDYYWRFTKETNMQARQMYEKAIELDPQYAAAYASLGATYTVEWIWQWSQDPQTLERAFALTQKAIALDDSLPIAHSWLGWVYMFKKQYERAIAEGEQALTLAPNDAEGHVNLGTILNLAGRPEEAIRLVEKAIRLNPRYPAHYLVTLGQAYTLTRQYEEAIAILKRATTRNPNFLAAYVFLAVVYSESSREEEARAAAVEILRISPNFSLEGFQQRIHYKDPAVSERFVTALRKAGLK
jgi:adenylate cyclase